jgi:alpha-mannosidase
MPDGESLTRQLLIGQRYFQKAYGVTARIGWNPDSFGYTWQLPQIYKKSGIDYFVTQKLDGNDFQRLPFRLFWWQSPDGSKVLTYFPNGYGNQNLNPGRLSTQLSRWRVLAPDATDLMDLYGTSDHGGGPTRAMFDDGFRWMQSDKVMPKMRFSTAQNFFNTVERKIDGDSATWNYRSVAKGFTPKPSLTEGRISVPTWNDEMYYEFHRGVMTTQANHKRNMRESEEAVLNSEKYASLAWLAGDNYPGERLTSSWKKVLFNQFHDLAAGSGIGVIFKEAEKDYEEVRCTTNEMTSKALESISAEVNTRAAGEVPVIVFNPLAWNRSGLVTVDVRMPTATAAGVSVLDTKNQVVPAKVLSRDHRKNTYKLLLDVRDVPSMGYKVLHVVPGSRSFVSDLVFTKPQGPLRLGGSEAVKRRDAESGETQRVTIENANLRVTVDRQTGFMTSLYNRKHNFETLAGPGNQLQTFADNPKCCDAWNIDPGTLDHPTIISKVDSVELVENDPLRATIRVTRSWQNSTFVQDITLYAGADQVEISNDIDWREKHTLLKVAFPLAATSNFATYEIPYGTIDRPTTRNNSWEKARFEVAALRWADLGDGKHGLSLINETKYGYDAEGNVLRLSLLRSPVSPDPNADQGHHHFTYSLYPHTGNWKQALTERRGYEYNYGLTAMQVYPHDGSLPLEYTYVAVNPENVVLTAMKKAEDSNALILRVVEWAGKSSEVRLNVPPGSTSAMVTNLMEKPEGSAIKVVNNTVTVPIHPYEILSVRVDYQK